MAEASLAFTPRLEITRRLVLFNTAHLPGCRQGAWDMNRQSGELITIERGDSRNERVIVVFGPPDELKERMAVASHP